MTLLLLFVLSLFGGLLRAQNAPTLKPEDKVQLLEMQNQLLHLEKRFAEIQVKLGTCAPDVIQPLQQEAAKLQADYGPKTKALADLKAKLEGGYEGYEINLLTYQLVKKADAAAAPGPAPPGG